jgi:hypothetical protein
MADGQDPRPVEPASEPVKEEARDPEGGKVFALPGTKAVDAPPREPPAPPQTTAASSPPAHAARDLLLVGTYVSGALVLACIVGALYLCWNIIALVEDGRTGGVNLRLLMSCVACFVAMAFGCLGFGLFLIQARGTFSASHGKGEGHRTAIESTAPGLIVIVCATVIMFLALDGDFKMGAPASVRHVDADATGADPVTAAAAQSAGPTPDAGTEIIP